MTDALVVGDGTAQAFKVDSTPHDLTVALMNLIDRAAAALNYDDRRSFLSDVSIIRWSSTVTTNTLAEKRGPKLGLLVDSGAQASLYGTGSSPAVGRIIAPENIISMDGDFDEQTTLAAARRLLEKGVRRICVSFAGAFSEPRKENAVKRTIAEQYPDHYLGAVPVLLGSEMAQTPDDMTRTHFTLINAYTHPALAASLFKAEDRLKLEENWSGTFLVGHINGGVARVGKTKAMDTIESGPVFGTYAAAYFAERYRLRDLLCFDVGGTTTKLSVVRDAAPVVEADGNLFDIPVKTPLQLLRSLALGGGSVAKVGTSGLQLGPESMGAAPGPACYGLGSGETTLTDCLLILGYLDATEFLDGDRQLDNVAAEKSVSTNIAIPLGIDIPAAAERVVELACTVLQEFLDTTSKTAGTRTNAVPLFAYGGNGPLLAALTAERLRISSVYVSFALGPVFSAFGTAISKVMHIYEHGVIPNATSELPDDIASTIEKQKQRAALDLEAEGFSGDGATFAVELEPSEGDTVMLDDGQPLPELDNVTGVVVRLRAAYPVPTYKPSLPLCEPTDSRSGERSVYFRGQEIKVVTHDVTRLQPEQTIPGPALISGGSTTCFVPPQWRLTVDEFGNGILQGT